MKVSIIIISYNEKEYILDSINSCLCQDIFEKGYECEIIITDDGSNDGTIKLLEEIKFKYPDIIKFIVMDRSNIEYLIPSLRASNAIKKALSIATGEYIQLLSADDILINKSKLSNAIMFLDNNIEYTSCYNDYIYFNDNGDIWNPNYKKANYSRDILWAYEYRHVSCYLFRNTVIPNLLDRFCDDTGFFYSSFLTGKTKYINSTTFAYRQRSSGITSSSNTMELYLNELLIMQDVFNKNSFLLSSYAKFYTPIIYVLKNRNELKNVKYEKFYIESSKYNNNFIKYFFDYNKLEFHEKLKIFSILVKALICKFIFKLKAIIESVIFV